MTQDRERRRITRDYGPPCRHQTITEIEPSADDIMVIGHFHRERPLIPDPTFQKCQPCPRTGIFREMCGDCQRKRYWIEAPVDPNLND